MRAWGGHHERQRNGHPRQYDWVWDGGFRTVVEGAYDAKGLLEGKEQGGLRSSRAIRSCRPGPTSTLAALILPHDVARNPGGRL